MAKKKSKKRRSKRSSSRGGSALRGAKAVGIAPPAGGGFPPFPGTEGQPPLRVELESNGGPTDRDISGFWAAVRDRTNAVGWSRYSAFIESVLCGNPSYTSRTDRDKKQKLGKGKKLGDLPMNMLNGVNAYDVLRHATQIFLMQECGLAITKFDGISEHADKRLKQIYTQKEIRDKRDKYLEDLGREYDNISVLPYFKTIIENLKGVPLKSSSHVPPNCYGILRATVEHPCLLELIWSYWMEEGMLTQSLNAISMRFQNMRGSSGANRLAHLEITPLRPLNHLLWGYIQGEQHRLTVVRRAYEYDHHYGLRLYGKAVQRFQPADTRSKFLEAFHTLLNRCVVFFKQVDDLTIQPDGFALLNSLRELHVILAEGAHNQYGDLPWTARVEMMIQQYLLSRPEMDRFLGGRQMIPYPAGWMGPVDTMKRLQGWSDASITHFGDLAVMGEQLLLTVRFANWMVLTPADAASWANYWRTEIQRYIHAYRAVTGVDLSMVTGPEKVDSVLPSEHLRKRLAQQAGRA